MVVFFFNDTATTEIYTLSLHDALPIFARLQEVVPARRRGGDEILAVAEPRGAPRVRHGELEARVRRQLHRLRRELRHVRDRSEEHTSELQSRQYIVCRLLLAKNN